MRSLYKFSSVTLLSMVCALGIIMTWRSQPSEGSQLEFLAQSWANRGIDQLIQDLQSSSSADVRWKAADELGQRKAPSQIVIAALVAALKDSDHEVRARAAVSLGLKGESANLAVPSLIITLKDSDKKVRRHTAWALGMMGESAKVAVPELITILQDPYADARNDASVALCRIGEQTYCNVR
jgi:HEAT repeat protein